MTLSCTSHTCTVAPLEKHFCDWNIDSDLPFRLLNLISVLINVKIRHGSLLHNSFRHGPYITLLLLLLHQSRSVCVMLNITVQRYENMTQIRQLYMCTVCEIKCNLLKVDIISRVTTVCENYGNLYEVFYYEQDMSQIRQYVKSLANRSVYETSNSYNMIFDRIIR